MDALHPKPMIPVLELVWELLVVELADSTF